MMGAAVGELETRSCDEIGAVLSWPATHDQVAAAAKLVPDQVVQMITASGTAEECRAKVADYVAAHECAHLLELNHGPRFWAHVRTLVGDERRHRAWKTSAM